MGGAFSPALKKSIEERIRKGTLKVAGQPKTVKCIKPNSVAIKNGQMTKMQALGRLKDREMNKTERAYSQHLELLKASGDVLWWEFEAIRLRLADNTTYTPDFFVMASNGQLEVHEIKGYAMDDSMVKLKVADEIFPFRFLLIRAEDKACTRWKVKEIGNRN